MSKILPLARSGDRLVGPLADLGEGGLVLCHRKSGARDLAKNPRTTEPNVGGSRTWFRTNGHSRILIEAYEWSGVGSPGKARAVALFESTKTRRTKNIECFTPSKADIDRWIKDGGGQTARIKGKDVVLSCGPRWALPHSDVVADFNSNPQDYGFIRLEGNLPSFGAPPVERSRALRSRHEARLEAITRRAIIGLSDETVPSNTNDALREVSASLVSEEEAVRASARALYEQKALILAMLSLGAPDLLTADAYLARFFYSSKGLDRLMDPFRMIIRLDDDGDAVVDPTESFLPATMRFARPFDDPSVLPEDWVPTAPPVSDIKQNPLMQVLWMRNSGKRRAEKLRAYFQELGVAKETVDQISLNSEFARVMNDLSMLLALQMEATGLLTE